MAVLAILAFRAAFKRLGVTPKAPDLLPGGVLLPGEPV